MSRARAVRYRRMISESCARAWRAAFAPEKAPPDERYRIHPQGHHRFYEVLGASRAQWVGDYDFGAVPMDVIELAVELVEGCGGGPIEPHRIPRRMRP